MTEKKWRLCVNPQEMLWFLGEEATERKARLFLCACCRRGWHFVKDERLKALLPRVEEMADRDVTDRDRDEVRELARSVTRNRLDSSATRDRLDSSQYCLGVELEGASGKTYRTGVSFDNSAATGLFGEFAACAFGHAAKDSEFNKAKKAERKMQTTLVREIFGNPFHRVKFNEKWRTTDVLLLAHGIYAERAFDRMPILADALQDAGCDSDDILTHLRDPQPAHVRGCWALDLVLGKE